MVKVKDVLSLLETLNPENDFEMYYNDNRLEITDVWFDDKYVMCTLDKDETYDRDFLN